MNRIVSLRDKLSIAIFYLWCQVVDSCPAIAEALGFTGGKIPREVHLDFHVCDLPDCAARADNYVHIRAYTSLNIDDFDEYRKAWTRKSTSEIVVETLEREFEVRVPISLRGIELQDMFPDPKTGKRFYYQPTPDSVHRDDRKRTHHLNDPEHWRCGFYVCQILWLRSATRCFDGDVPHNEELRSRYIPEPSWPPGKTSTIRSSVIFGQQFAKALIIDLQGINSSEHKVNDVSALVNSLMFFMDKKAESKQNSMFGWKNFWMRRNQRKQVACEVAKIVYETIGRLTFTELHV